ncbi:uncharacterized protein LOC134533005, partial [Bacillus rossius redtenbacheri]|uniref:uncharacterized protein LOC134533005 n=1 Tax=Bacillus rossius redtenbacheri TaxID=93214 RepID=UPI002FDD6D4D
APEAPGGGGLSKCSCEGPACDCCVDFNLTFIDLGGPGCVRMKYVSPEDGIAVNVSYGDSLLHSEAVKGANPPPACIDVLSDLAQLCARFVDLAPTRDGLRWCLQVEPTLLGGAQAEYHVGCFRMAPAGMQLDPAYNRTRPPPASSAGTEAPAEEAQINEEALLAAVSESAEQGIAFFSNLLGLALAPDNTTTAPDVTTAQPPAAGKHHSARSALNGLE